MQSLVCEEMELQLFSLLDASAGYDRVSKTISVD